LATFSNQKMSEVVTHGPLREYQFSSVRRDHHDNHGADYIAIEKSVLVRNIG